MSASLSSYLDAIITLVESDAQIKTLIGDPPRVFNALPTSSVFPYLHFNFSDAKDAGVKSISLRSVSLNCIVYHRDKTTIQAEDILDRVRTILHDVDLAGVVRCQEELVTFQSSRDSQQALARYRLIVMC